MSELDDAVARAFDSTVTFARAQEKLLVTGRHLNLVLEDIRAAIEAEPFLAPELGAMLGSLIEVSEAIGRARAALDAKYSILFGLDETGGSG